MKSRREFIKKLGFTSVLPFINYGSNSELLKNEIPLFDFYIAGLGYYEGNKIIGMLRAGDELILKREPENEFDDQAVEIYTKDGSKLGYVPMESNIVLKNLMDNKVTVKAYIKEIDNEADDFEKVFVSVSQSVQG